MIHPKKLSHLNEEAVGMGRLPTFVVRPALRVWKWWGGAFRGVSPCSTTTLLSGNLLPQVKTCAPQIDPQRGSPDQRTTKLHGGSFAEPSPRCGSELCIALFPALAVLRHRAGLLTIIVASRLGGSEGLHRLCEARV